MEIQLNKRFAEIHSILNGSWVRFEMGSFNNNMNGNNSKCNLINEVTNDIYTVRR